MNVASPGVYYVTMLLAFFPEQGDEGKEAKAW
jgi:hypothetical protein